MVSEGSSVVVWVHGGLAVSQRGTRKLLEDGDFIHGLSSDGLWVFTYAMHQTVPSSGCNCMPFYPNTLQNCALPLTGCVDLGGQLTLSLAQERGGTPVATSQDGCQPSLM